MAKIPAHVLKAAADAILSAQNANDDEPERWEAMHLANTALEAAAVPLGEYVAQAILAHRDAHGPDDGNRMGAWRRHFGIAARVAARAFLDDDDVRRLAAEAITRGDMVRCAALSVPPEVGGGDV